MKNGKFERYIKDIANLEGYDENKVKNNELILDKNFLSDSQNRFYSKNICRWIFASEIINSQIDFARKYNLNNDCITHCLKVRNKSHKGWIFEYIK